MTGAHAPAQVLVVEDDPTVAEVVIAYLEREGYRVTWKTDGAEGLAHAELSLPDLAILDLMLPTLDGIEVCRRLRAHAPVPVIMLTARGSEEDRIAGLELGADDYVAKPFSPRELMARVKAVLRRAQEPTVSTTSDVVESGDLVVDARARQATRGAARVELTAREFDLLLF
ncbi:MAG TPA: response regulator transcription factor, partial [Acidimicrobiia bacterium]|nr:response regulator transcription factor [Acidimicrobiia bacterium]